jgi:hypothetical protein
MLGLSGCNFLDKNPDMRTDIDTKRKVQLLLVNAYDAPNYGPLGEFCSDNMVDNNTPDKNKKSLNKTPLSTMCNELFAWEDVTSDNAQDSPYHIWEHCYKNIAVANQALKACDELEAKGERMSTERAEALICRAYNHFILVNIFCKAYRDPELSKEDLGIHYMTEIEKTVNPQYERGTVAEVYEKIQQDLEEALPYISDEYYSVPKYHFNTKAAYAFAARFYLFTRQYEKVIACAERVLGPTAATAAPLMFDAASCIRLGNVELELHAWCDAASQANLLIQTTMSWEFYYFWLDYARYTFNREPEDETLDGSGPCWSSRFPGISTYSFGQQYGGWSAKVWYLFEYVNKEAGIGYAHALRREFTTGETLLCRAEAEIMLGRTADAVADMDVWAKGYTCKNDLTSGNIESFFRWNPNNVQRTPALHNTDICPTWTIPSDKLPYIWCVLHFRRIETLHDGMRWFDIKRYGIELTHAMSNGNGVDSIRLVWDDDRRAIQLPQEVLLAGQQANPRVNIGTRTGGSLISTQAIPNSWELYLKTQKGISTVTKKTDFSEEDVLMSNQ